MVLPHHAVFICTPDLEPGKHGRDEVELLINPNEDEGEEDRGGDVGDVGDGVRNPICGAGGTGHEGNILLSVSLNQESACCWCLKKYQKEFDTDTGVQDLIIRVCARLADPDNQNLL